MNAKRACFIVVLVVMLLFGLASVKGQIGGGGIGMDDACYFGCFSTWCMSGYNTGADPPAYCYTFDIWTGRLIWSDGVGAGFGGAVPVGGMPVQTPNCSQTVRNWYSCWTPCNGWDHIPEECFGPFGNQIGTLGWGCWTCSG